MIFLFIVQVSFDLWLDSAFMLLVDVDVLQVFDNTPAAKEGTLESGDELVGINDTNVKVT